MIQIVFAIVLLAGVEGAPGARMPQSTTPQQVRQQLVQAKASTTLAANVDANAQLEFDPLALSPLELADRFIKEEETLELVENKLSETKKSLLAGVAVIRSGLCAYKGFCEMNPATSCDAIAQQDRVKTAVGVANLPDGKYWLKADKADYPGVATILPPPQRINCKFDENGDGWTEMFDEFGASEINQEPKTAILKRLRFRKVMVYTNDMLVNNLEPVVQQLYYVNPESSTSGKTLDQMHSYDWVGQDEDGKKTRTLGEYPHDQYHYRFKYFGVTQPKDPWRKSLFILDDGDVKDDTCKLAVDLDTMCGQEVFCSEVNGRYVLNGKVPQTSMPKTRRGIISFGCSSSSASFTQCGSCTYTGPEDDQQRAMQVKSSVVQRMFVKM